jgi:hypothetical protein
MVGTGRGEEKSLKHGEIPRENRGEKPNAEDTEKAEKRGD